MTGDDKKKRSVSPRAKLGRKGTMDQTIAEGLSFLQSGNYHDGDKRVRTVLGKRAASRSPEPPKKKPRTRSKSPTKPKSSGTGRPKVARPKRVKSTSPKRPAKKSPPPKSTPKPKPVTTVAVPPPVSTSRLVPTVWRHDTDRPAFGLFVAQGRCWMANDCGDIYGFNLDGKLERHIKLPSGVKAIVYDMGYWLYAGCDNGLVYDITSESEPRIAYQFQDLDDSEEIINEPRDLTTISNTFEIPPIKPRHVVFCIDISGSMSGHRIKSVTNNMRMMYENNLRDEDSISLITFSSGIRTVFAKQRKGNPDEDKKMRAFLFSDDLSRSCNGLTAFWDACTSAWSQFEDTEDEEQWVIALTDGCDNRSAATNQSVADLAKSKRANFVCIFVHSDPSYQKNISNVCEQTKRGLLIPVHKVGDGTGITAAFKQVAQLLSSRIMWMDVRDGLLTVSDNEGRVVAANIEGIPLWEQKSQGTCGWMVRCDMFSVYHGHSKGVSAYDSNGKIQWFTPLPEGVLFGWEDKKKQILFVGAGKNVYVIQGTDGKVVSEFHCDNTVTSTTASYGTDETIVYASDVYGFIYAFDSQTSNRTWTLQTNAGAALSMQFFDQKLYLVTANGSLLCVSLKHEDIVQAMKGIISSIKTAEIPSDISVTTPISDIGETNDPGSSAIVEIFQEFTDDQVLLIAKAIQDPNATVVSVGGSEYPIELHKNGCRCARIGGLLYIAQNLSSSSKYAAMAKKGSQITWVKNSGRWGLIIDDEVKINGTRLLARVADIPHNQKLFPDKLGKQVQFPINIREKDAQYVVEDLTESETGEFLRVKGSIKKLVAA